MTANHSYPSRSPANPFGSDRRYRRTALTRWQKVTEPNPAGGEWETHYTYDGRDLLVQVSMARDGVTQVRSFEYNGIAPYLSVGIDPATNRLVGVSYDANGNPTSLAHSVGLGGGDAWDYHRALDYYPYGEEKPGATAQGREKFGTYYRDNTGLDYAMNRYYHSGHGRFVTPDPAAPGDPANPQSWNLYSYVEGDPINLNDPDGLVPCSQMVLTPYNKTLGELLTTSTDEGLFGLLIFSESNPPTQSSVTSNAFFTQQDAIASTVWNRYRILNGEVRLPNVPVSTLRAWGPENATIQEVIAGGQFQVIQGGPNNPHLSSRAQRDLDLVLGQEQSTGSVFVPGPNVTMTPGCFALWQSYVTGSAALFGLIKDPFAAAGFITTSFNSDPANIKPGMLEQRVGQIGGNTFFGIPTPPPVPRNDPHRRIGRPGGARR